VRWNLIAKQFEGQPEPEIRLTRCTETARRNHQRHGWVIIDRWPMRPTETRIQEVIFNWRQAS
jgi:hypothetical protein